MRRFALIAAGLIALLPAPASAILIPSGLKPLSETLRVPAVVSAVAEDAATTALVGRMTTPPSAARRKLIDNLIVGLKADGLWAKLDWFVMLAAPDAQAARLNWITTKELTPVNTPTFTPDRGYAGDAASAYLDFGEGFQAGGKYLATNASLGFWANGLTGTTRYSMGNNNAGLRLGGGTTSALARFNNAANGFSVTGLTSSTSRHFTLSRTSDNTAQSFIYLDGQQAASASSSGVNPSSVNAQLLAGGTSYSDHRIAAGYFGGGLSAADVANLHARLSTFLSAIGAN